MMVLSMWLTHYDHELNAVHNFNPLFIYNRLFGAQDKIKSVLALLNWKVNFKLFDPEMGQNQSMYLQRCFYIWF